MISAVHADEGRIMRAEGLDATQPHRGDENKLNRQGEGGENRRHCFRMDSLQWLESQDPNQASSAVVSLLPLSCNQVNEAQRRK